MAYQLSWMIPNRIILVEVNGVIDEGSVRTFDQTMLTMLDEGDADAALIHHIMVFGEIVGRPNLKLLTSVTYPQHPRNGWMITVGNNNPLIRMVNGLAAQILQMRVAGIDTVEEALELLYEMDSTIPRDDDANVWV